MIPVLDTQSPRPLPTPTTTLSWVLADHDLWVADDDGRFAGTVERQGGHHFVRNAFAEYLGDFRSVAAAAHTLAAAVAQEWWAR